MSNKENIVAPHRWSFVLEIPRWPFDSPHNGSAMRKGFSWHDVAMRQYYHACKPLEVNHSDMEAVIHAGTNLSILILSSAFDVLDVTFACQALKYHMKCYEMW